MDSADNRFKALFPEDLADFFVRRINRGDLEGLVALYEPDAILVIDSNGNTITGSNEIRDFYKQLLVNKPQFEKGVQRPAILHGDLALTSSRLVNGTVTAEVARKQPDGSWLWIIDQPSIAMEVPDKF